MSQALISIRRAAADDALQLADAHDLSWRDAYRGVIPGLELEKMIARRGPHWWLRAVSKGSRILVLEFEDRIRGYICYGRNRAPSLAYSGEIFELYLIPSFQGQGFGAYLFEAARRDLQDHGFCSCLVWALSDNLRAVSFYQRMGGAVLRHATETFGEEKRERVAFGFL